METHRTEWLRCDIVFSSCTLWAVRCVCVSGVPWANEREKLGEEQQGGLRRLTPLPTDTPAASQPSALASSGAPLRGRIVYQGLFYVK